MKNSAWALVQHEKDSKRVFHKVSGKLFKDQGISELLYNHICALNPASTNRDTRGQTDTKAQPLHEGVRYERIMFNLCNVTQIIK